jgi:N4-gp56 family major capsid protein
MAVTTTTTLDASVVTAYERDYLLAFMQKKVWATLCWQRMLRKVVGGRDLAGKTVQVPVYEPLSVPTASLTEHLDVTPEAWADSSVSITIAEEGNVVQKTRMLNMTSYVELGQPIASAIGQNMAKRVDRIIRDAVVFNATDVIYGGTATSRVTCDTTADKITYAKVVEAVVRAQNRGVPSFPDGSYATVVNPALMADVVGLTEWTAVAEYSDPTMIVTGDISVIGKGGRFPDEKGRLFNLRFLTHEYGKLFLGAGTAAQAATSLSADAAAGATSLSVGDATGFAAGTYVTVGTLESSTTAQPTTEQVLITAVDGTTLTIRGAGNAFGNWGLKFAHSSGASVIEAPNVAAIPVLGPESMVLAFADEVGQDGEVAIEWASTNIPRRFQNHSWYWVGGSAIVDKNVVMLEVATTGNILGEN